MDNLRKQVVTHEGIRYVCGHWPVWISSNKAHAVCAWQDCLGQSKAEEGGAGSHSNNLPQRALCADQPYQGVLCHLDLPGGSNQGTLTGQVLLIPRILTRVMIPRTMLTAKWQRQKPVKMILTKKTILSCSTWRRAQLERDLNAKLKDRHGLRLSVSQGQLR